MIEPSAKLLAVDAEACPIRLGEADEEEEHRPTHRSGGGGDRSEIRPEEQHGNDDGQVVEERSERWATEALLGGDRSVGHCGEAEEEG